jgi:two-component system response regulator MprA
MPGVSDERPPARVLLVEDDRGVRESLARALSLEGYEVETTPDGIEAMQVVDKLAPDVIVLDVMMPVMDGLEVARRIRSRGDLTPILMLTARHEVTDRVAGLDAGADDYLPKPFDLDELFARMRALLRRASEFGTGEPPTGPDELILGDLRLDPAGRRAIRNGCEIELSKTEYDLLELLVRNAGIVLDHSTIYERIWNYDFGPDSKNLAVYIGYLRRKTEAEGDRRLIHTVRGVGYVARTDDP